MSLKEQFPFFQHNPSTVYLDSAATTQKPKSVIDAIDRFYQADNVNVHRGSYRAAKQATNDYEQSRIDVAKHINAYTPSDIVWTKGTTDSINTVAMSWAQHQLNTGDRIVLLASEHHANFVPWQQLALNKGLEIDFIELTEDGVIDLAQYAEVMKQQPKFVAMQHVSNALGNIHPIEQMTKMAKAVGATVLIDGAQAIAHIEVDVQALNCDFYAFSGHKMFGPTGIGVLYIAPFIKSQIRPVQLGGEMIRRVSRQETTFRPLPALLETGTPNIAGVIALKAAINFIESEKYHAQHERIQSLYHGLVAQLEIIDGIKIYGDPINNVGVVSFTYADESVSDLGALLDQQGIAVRVGHHCAMPLMDALGINGTVRVSLAAYNDQEDVDRFISALNHSIEILDI
ncbi:cysteine desulfurase [Psychrosphaera ytuae]|uniref:Cysteine desulfurase n=1 Tax=Psychrosphaera ytuae TaxID=2820710 RepID=A0A975DBA5_9GAMM|nr:cysteine desulfurase [Psychrosphaera ytuae]QTH63997.1 cysteine desulfurase [Psychrosphaera ytuae]